MKAHLHRIVFEPEYSFSIRKDFTAKMDDRWHFHEEIELIHFHRGGGILCLGDHIHHIQTGDMVLIGANLPHYFRNDQAIPLIHELSRPVATIIHFSEKLWGERFLCLPEFQAIKTLLIEGKRGLLIREEDAASVGFWVEKAYQLAGAGRMIALLECLHAFSGFTAAHLSSVFYNYSLIERENERLTAIYNYSLNYFKRKIHLEEIAGIACMAPNSFCRYFKSITGKTYSRFLVEIKIGYACKLLLAGSHSIKQVCFESGFHNFSCFHSTFKQLKGQTPQAYRQYGRSKLTAVGPRLAQYVGLSYPAE